MNAAHAFHGLAVSCLCLAVSATSFAAEPAPVGVGLSLGAALDRAMERSTDIAIARARLEEARAGRSKVTTAFLPNIQAVGSFTHNSVEAKFDSGAMVKGLAAMFGKTVPPDQLPAPSIIQRQDTIAGVLTIDETVLALAPVLAGRAADRSVEAQTASLEATRREIAFQLTQIFYNVAGIERMIQASERALALADERIASVSQRRRLGAEGEVPVLRAQTERGRAELDLARAQLARRQLLVAMGTLMGEEAPAAIEAPPEIELPNGDTQTWVDTGVRERADLKARRLAVQAASASVDEASWRWMPMVTVQGVGRYTDTPGFVGKNWLWSATANLVVPVFDRGVRYVEARERRHTWSRLRLELDKAEQDVRAGVQQAAIEIETERKACAIANAQAEKAKRTAEIVGKAFAAGGATSLDVSEADTNLRASDLAALRERISLDLAILRLRHLTGAVRAP